MADLSIFQSYTNTPQRRNSFYCYSTKFFIQDAAIFFILVEAYRTYRSKRQAVFLNDWFIDGKIPDDLQEGGYLSQINISSDLRKEYSKGASDAVNAVGRTFADKAKNHGGGITGFFGALKQKTGDNRLSAGVFDEPQSRVVEMLDSNNAHGFGDDGGAGATFKPHLHYQPFGKFATQTLKFRGALKAVGFNPDTLGIY